MTMSVVTQRQSIPWSSSLVTLQLLLDRIGGPGTVELVENDKKLQVFKCIDLVVEGKVIIMEWEATPINDMFADSVLACIMQTELGGTNIKGTAGAVKPDRTHFKECLIETFQDTFGEQSVPKLFKGDILPVTVSGKKAEVDLETLVRTKRNLFNFYICEFAIRIFFRLFLARMMKAFDKSWTRLFKSYFKL